jgi:hypothetical protein
MERDRECSVVAKTDLRRMAWRATTKKSTRKGVYGKEYVKLEANKNAN